MSNPLEPISDEKLFTDGLEMREHGGVLLVTCGALALEILALIEAKIWAHMHL